MLKRYTAGRVAFATKSTEFWIFRPGGALQLLPTLSRSKNQVPSLRRFSRLTLHFTLISSIGLRTLTSKLADVAEDCQALGQLKVVDIEDGHLSVREACFTYAAAVRIVDAKIQQMREKKAEPYQT